MTNLLRKGIIGKDSMDETIRLFDDEQLLERKLGKYEKWDREKFGMRRVNVLVLDADIFTETSLIALREVIIKIEQELALRSMFKDK